MRTQVSGYLWTPTNGFYNYTLLWSLNVLLNKCYFSRWNKTFWLERYGSDGSKKVNLTLRFQTGEFQPISPPLEALILLGYLLENFANPCCLPRNRMVPITSNPHEKQRKSVVFLSSNVYSLTHVIKTYHRSSFKAVYFSPQFGGLPCRCGKTL